MAYTYARPSRTLTLATDLDGTFLGGSDSDRQRLYSLIESSRKSIRLLFVTGRSFQSVQPLFGQFGLPVPDALICDVGTSVHLPDGRWFCELLRTEIAASWGDGHVKIASALADIEGLEQQTRTGPFRLSYFFSEVANANAAKTIVESLGFDGLISDNKYFDVLPQGVNKGSTLQRVIRSLEIDQNSVLVAGDTFNDLSMLISG
ncbi:MAG: HAD family hydrolase, partial [Burkholderiales bacterium]|nr:HAD family hydrolase [Burkholderiales bacterium]